MVEAREPQWTYVEPVLVELWEEHEAAGHTISELYAGRIEEVSEEGHTARYQTLHLGGSPMQVVFAPEVIKNSNRLDSRQGDSFYWIVYRDTEGKLSQELRFRPRQEVTPEDRARSEQRAQEKICWINPKIREAVSSKFNESKDLISGIFSSDGPLTVAKSDNGNEYVKMIVPGKDGLMDLETGVSHIGLIKVASGQGEHYVIERHFPGQDKSLSQFWELIPGSNQLLFAELISGESKASLAGTRPAIQEQYAMFLEMAKQIAAATPAHDLLRIHPISQQSGFILDQLR